MNFGTKSFKMGGANLLSFVFALVFLGFNACKKDTFLAPVAHDTQVSLSAMDRDGEVGGNNEEKAAIAQHIQGIQDFRTKVGGWRTTPTSETMPASEVVEKTEIAFNYNLGDITSVFEGYATAEMKISVPATSATWSSGTIAGFYDAVKAQVKAQLDAGPNRTLRLMQLGIPTLQNGSYQVDVFVMTGVNKQSGPPNSIPESLNLRWAEAPDGFTNPTACGGRANERIGIRVNNALGYYQSFNAGPGSGGNTPRPGVIISAIVRGDHNLFGADFPSGSNFPLAYPPVKTFETAKQSLHYNSIAFAPAVPPLNCLDDDQIDAYESGNITLGASMLSVVPKAGIKNQILSRRLVATVVSADFGSREINFATQGDLKARVQEHPTRHFYAVFGEINDVQPTCCTVVDEM